jgi:hypothetical protein
VVSCRDDGEILSSSSCKVCKRGCLVLMTFVVSVRLVVVYYYSDHDATTGVRLLCGVGD